MIHALTALILLISQVGGFLFPSVFAGGLSNGKVTITDSRPSHAATGHTFDFTTSTTGTIATVTFEYCTSPSGTCNVPTGLVTTGGSQGSITGLSASTSNFTSNGTIVLTVTSPASINSGTAITIPYTGITNPSTPNTSFFVKITTRDGGNAVIDNSMVAFATLTASSMTVTADVGSTLQVTVTAVNTGTVNGAAVNLSSTTADTIPFGTLYSGSSKVAAHDISVTTNASHGYVVTLASSDPPLVDNSNNIDKFTGTNASPTSWSAPAGGSANTNTGFVGYTTEDSTLCTGTAARFTSSGGNKWAGADTTPAEVLCNSGAVISGETVRIGWRAEVNSVQPPGSYSGTFLLVTTPTY